MAKLEFTNFIFEEQDNNIRVIFLKNFYFYLDKQELKKIGNFKLNKNSIEFDCSQKRAENKFMLLIDKEMQNLKSIITNNPATYIYKNMNIPLIGSTSFGLVDRNTNVIEIKPVTGCNFNCIFCSVGEGLSSKKQDFVIEKDFLVQEFNKLAEFKGIDDIEAHINPHGEPLLYGNIVELVRGLRKNKKVKVISINTNTSLLTKQLIDDLIDAGITRFNCSINARDPKIAMQLAGVNIDVRKRREMLEYIAKKSKLLIAPVIVPKYNEKDIEEVVKLCKELNCICAIQKYLEYKRGRKPVKEISWKNFLNTLRRLEKKYNIKLIFNFKKDFNIHPTKKLQKPFKKGNIIKGKVVLPGRNKNECFISYKERLVNIINCSKNKKEIKCKIIRDKHNIFVGKAV